MSDVDRSTLVRIGELARRTGTSPELLRAWEQRYGLLTPSRSAGGFRLYSDEDERRVRATIALIDGGLSAAEAAARALTGARMAGGSDRLVVADLADRLERSLDGFESDGAHRAIDALLSSVTVETLIQDVLLPYLRALGDRWERGKISVAQEHFASNLIRGRLLGLARDWAAGPGPTLVLACPPAENHDLSLIMFGIAVARRGRRIVFLGADTPIDTLRDTVATTNPSAVVLSVSRPDPLRDHRDALRELSRDVPVLIAGEGATPDEVEDLGASVLAGDPVEAARELGV